MDSIKQWLEGKAIYSGGKAFIFPHGIHIIKRILKELQL
jgi:hypothetical protein